jgi:uncharacterized protein (DUF1684 family)
MNKIFFLICILFYPLTSLAQKNNSYFFLIKEYQKNYVSSHEVVKLNNRKYFRFYNADEKFKVQCHFEKATDTATVVMKTSGKKIPQKDFVRYGKLSFIIHGTPLTLTVYQSKELLHNPQYSRYLFIPFTDLTSGIETYGSGRYIDIYSPDIKNNIVEIDFNKAYNPYCAYSADYNCPIPPRENYLDVAIKAGEKNFGKKTEH